jgi:Thioredoxin domain
MDASSDATADGGRSNVPSRGCRTSAASSFEKITEVVTMLDFGIIALPALAIDGKVVAMGTAPTPAEIGRHLLANERAISGSLNDRLGAKTFAVKPHVENS